MFCSRRFAQNVMNSTWQHALDNGKLSNLVLFFSFFDFFFSPFSFVIYRLCWSIGVIKKINQISPSKNRSKSTSKLTNQMNWKSIERKQKCHDFHLWWTQFSCDNFHDKQQRIVFILKYSIAWFGVRVQQQSLNYFRMKFADNCCTHSSACCNNWLILITHDVE